MRRKEEQVIKSSPMITPAEHLCWAEKNASKNA